MDLDEMLNIPSYIEFDQLMQLAVRDDRPCFNSNAVDLVIHGLMVSSSVQGILKDKGFHLLEGFGLEVQEQGHGTISSQLDEGTESGLYPFALGIIFQHLDAC